LLTAAEIFFDDDYLVYVTENNKCLKDVEREK